MSNRCFTFSEVIHYRAIFLRSSWPSSICQRPALPCTSWEGPQTPLNSKSKGARSSFLIHMCKSSGFLFVHPPLFSRYGNVHFFQGEATFSQRCGHRINHYFSKINKNSSHTKNIVSSRYVISYRGLNVCETTRDSEITWCWMGGKEKGTECRSLLGGFWQWRTEYLMGSRGIGRMRVIQDGGTLESLGSRDR